MSSIQKTAVPGREGSLTERLCAGLVAILVGSFLLLGTGFAQADLLHGAAHDLRHGFNFPCH